jgi:putative sugar O-methyltransferase
MEFSTHFELSMTRTVAKITNDEALLRLMSTDANSQPSIYRPGPYWRRKCRRALAELKRHGLADFRGDRLSIGESFTDCVALDVRNRFDDGLRKPLGLLFKSVPPFNKVMHAQVALTSSYAREARRLRNILFNVNSRVAELLAKYKMPYSLAGGCVDFVDVAGEKISAHYLSLLHQHDCVAKRLDFSTISSIFEIGGGFGVNVHLLLENYPQLRKVVYLDIPPNLYVGTEYLKLFYGDSVIDYRQTRGLDVIRFGDHDRIEILAIAPWQIERLDVAVDLIYDAHSFVAMGPDVVANYANWLRKLPHFSSTNIAMITFDNFDRTTTMDPETLPGFFPGRVFDRSMFAMLDERYGVIMFLSRGTRSATNTEREVQRAPA